MPRLDPDVTLALDPTACDDPGVTTPTIQNALDAAGEAGGGVVSIPPGDWEISTLFLRSGATLRLERGCTLFACTDLSRYPVMEAGHNKDRQPYHLIAAIDCEGVGIEGPGVIDGRGEAFWDPPLGDASQGAVGLFWRHKGARISPMVEIRNCRDVRLRDFTLANSPGWTLHPYLCDRVWIENVTVANSLFGPNTDGFDLNGCRDVFVSNCDLTCGDDAIIIKATDPGHPSERIVVTNCIATTNCAAFGLGAECSGDIRDIAFSNCVSKQALRIIQLEMWSEGTIENIVFSNITGRTMADVPLDRPIYMDVQSHGRAEQGDDRLGTMRNVVVSNFTCTTRGRIVLTAKDGSRIENVTLRDVHLRYTDEPGGGAVADGIEDASESVDRSRSSQMSNDNPASRARNAAVVADNVDGLRVWNLVTTWPDSPNVEYHGAWLRNVTGAVLDVPGLTASHAGHERVVQVGECEVDERG